MFTSLFVAMPVFIKKIGEEKYFQYGKHNKKFNDDNYPHFSAPARHVAESIIIKTEKPFQKRGYISHIIPGYSLERNLRFPR